jgi:hypothetical protein
MAIETAMIMTIYLNEAMNKMVEKMVAVRQLPRTSSDNTLLMALQTEAKINDGFGFSIWISILWSTGTELM